MKSALSVLRRLSGSAWAVLEYGWYPLLVFAFTPYLLRSLGANQYGHWMLVNAAMGAAVVLSGGTSVAIIKQISALRGRSAGTSVEQIINSSLALSLLSGGMLAVTILAVFLLGGDSLFQKMGDKTLIQLTGCVAALLAWLEQIDNVFSSALKGAEQFGRAARIEAASKTVQIIAAVLAVSIWGDLWGLYAALVFVSALRVTIKSRMVQRYFAIQRLVPRWVQMTEILRYAKWGWVQGLGGLAFGVADRFLIGAFVGAAGLAHYSVASQLAQQIHTFHAAALSVLFPKVSRNIEGDRGTSLKKIAKLAVAGTLISSGVMASILLLYGKPILALWLGEPEAEAGADVLWYLTIAYWVLAINVVPHFMLLGAGRMRFVALSNMVAGGVLLVAMYLLVQSNGLVGVGVARILYGIVISVNFLALFDYLSSIKTRIE